MANHRPDLEIPIRVLPGRPVLDGVIDLLRVRPSDQRQLGLDLQWDADHDLVVLIPSGVFRIRAVHLHLNLDLVLRRVDVRPSEADAEIDFFVGRQGVAHVANEHVWRVLVFVVGFRWGATDRLLKKLVGLFRCAGE